ncbi:MAG: DUF4440 domain-containing protein [Rhodothermia bacterium]|nr:DUF4440 domain-containing protein [Rhodothermia bacterium]
MLVRTLVLVSLFASSTLVGTPSALSQEPPNQQPPGEAVPVQVELPPAFDSVLRAYEDGWKRRDAEALADLFTEDGFVLRPGHPPARGRSAIVRAYGNSGGPLVLRAYDFGEDGSLGYIIGGFARQPDDPDIGKYVLVLTKSEDGRWRIVADMDNGNSR